MPKRTKKFQHAAALWEQYMNAEDERREIRERLENASGEYQSAMRRSQEAWSKIEAQKESAANDQVKRNKTMNNPDHKTATAHASSAYHCELCDTKHHQNAGCHDERPIEVPGERIKCPHCGSGLLWSEDRGAHCDGCDDFDPEADLPNGQAHAPANNPK